MTEFFSYGDRVETTLAWEKYGKSMKGTVTGKRWKTLGRLSLSVRPDGRKSSSAYWPGFWKKVSEQVPVAPASLSSDATSKS